MLIKVKGKSSIGNYDSKRLTPSQRAESLYERNKINNAQQAEYEDIVNETKEDEMEEKNK